MSRVVISEEELLNLLNQEISKDEAVASCSISGIYKLKKEVKDACNWAVVFFSSPRVPLSVSEPRIQEIVAKIQPHYNVQ